VLHACAGARLRPCSAALSKKPLCFQCLVRHSPAVVQTPCISQKLLMRSNYSAAFLRRRKGRTWRCISAALLTALTAKGGAAPAKGGEQNYAHRYRPLRAVVGKGRSALLREVAQPENAQPGAAEIRTSVMLLRIAVCFLACFAPPPKDRNRGIATPPGSLRYIARSFVQLYPYTLRARRRRGISLAGWNCRVSGEATLQTKWFRWRWMPLAPAQGCVIGMRRLGGLPAVGGGLAPTQGCERGALGISRADAGAR
jgi:hypothetical protein